MPSPSSSIPHLRILRAYAKLDDASLVATLPPTIYFSHTRYTLTIFDAYPKALFHFLVLPRLHLGAPTTTTTTTTTPGPAASSSSRESDGNGDERRECERDSEVVVADSTADLTSLRTLLQRAAAPTDTNSNSNAGRARAKGTLSVLSDEATRLQSKIEREMHAHHGFKWPIWTGFHAVPSME